ncbi:MAG: DNA-processing protein DprA, partial [Candidatus Latescibacteria bacterium]|nr:DNA-processing protein DprA [Candidatus Latescibacterota bacterium]
MAGDVRDWLILSGVPGLGPAAFSGLLSRFRSPKAVLRAPLRGLCQVPGIGEETAQAIRGASSRSWASDQMTRAAGAEVQIVTLKDPAYPRLLKRIYAPPPVLFARGDLQARAAPAIAIVGSRSFTSYGRDCAFRLAADLAELGI